MKLFSHNIKFCLILFSFLSLTKLDAQCINVFPHVEDFESGPVWKSHQFYPILPAPGNDWAWGAPAHPIINSAGSGAKAWCIGTLTGSFYNFNEQSWVQSPCYDFTNLKYPHIALKIFYESEWKYDGTKLQYSFDTTNWVTIGAYNDPNDCNTANWYNTNSTSSYSASTITGGGPKPIWFPATDPTAKDSWAGNVRLAANTADDPTHVGVTCYCCNGSGHWLVAQHCLTGLAGQPKVFFRITFSCGYACNNFDGFAFDSVAVSNGIPNSAIVNSTCVNPNTINFTATSPACPTNTYSWNFGDPASGASNTITATTTPSHTFSAAGTYTVTLIASGGACNPPDTITKVVNVISGTVSTGSVSCNGGNATITMSGGVPPYTYAWSNGQTTSTATNLSTGNYSVTVTTLNSCPITETVSITQPAAITTTVNSTNSSCTSSTGTTAVSVSGGSGTFSYSWSTLPIQTTTTATGLSAGTYSVLITDVSGCTATATANVINANGPQASVLTTSITCNGANNGTATVTASGGTGTLTYSWSPTGGNNTTANGLSPGTYTCIVSDASGCTQPETIVITQPSAITTTVTFTSANCHGGGSATVGASGGTPSYTYLWTPSGGTNSVATNLSAGAYSVTVTDANGCTHVGTTIVASTTSMTVGLLSTTTVSCSGGANGSAIVSANGGTSPYTYIWSAPGGTNATATGLSAGTYTCNITDANGCSQTQLATISQPPPITLSVTATPVPCGLANGTASVNAAGGTAPYTYLWLTTPVQSNSQLNNLPVGNYSVIVTDANGCNQIQTVNVPQSNPPPHANFNVTPDVISWLDASVNFINTSSGSSIWAWNFGDGNFSTQQNPFHTYPDTGTYCITLIASDTIGICKDSITKCLPYECVFTFYIPNAFTPNNDGLNELFLGKGTCIQDFNLYVFDRWGNKIFQANDITQGWDGKVQRGLGGKVVQEDVYVWKVYITEYSGKKHSYVGRVSVVK